MVMPKKQVNPQGVDLIDEYESPQRVHQTETQNLDDSGNQIDDNYPESPQPSPQSSPQPSPVADSPPSPDEETALNLRIIEELLLGDLDELDQNERLSSIEEPPSSTVTNTEPQPQPSTSRDEPGLNLPYLRFLIEGSDQDSDND